MDVEGVHLGVGDFEAGRIGLGVDLAADLQASVGCGGGDQLDNGLVADERPSAPVLGDEREEAMLDLVPFAGAGGRWQTVMGMASSSAKACSSRFHKRTRTPLLPPQSAVIRSRLASG